MKENGIVHLKEEKEINEILKLISLIPGFRRASLLSATFINQLVQSIITIIDVKILLYKSLKDIH
jgi:hypothetical protein